MNKLQEMMGIQNKLNCHIDPLWSQKQYAWERAIWVECAEAMEHLGYKWWKHQEPDINQVKMELVDIWHFAMSLNMEDNKPIYFEKTDPGDLRLMLDNIAGEAASHKSFDNLSFCIACASIGMNFNKLYELYMRKAVLNLFRQDHGYKKGTYVKIWQGLEDNEVVATLPVEGLYESLEECYQEALNNG